MTSTTILGSTIQVEGEVSGDGRLVVQGSVKGRIQARAGLTVERSAVVEAEIETDQAQIAGQVRGRINARQRVEITADGRVQGDLRAPRILIADGAQFKGNVDMDERG